MINQKKKFKVAVFLDGRPGHEKQTLSILNSLEKRKHVQIKFIKIKKESILSQIIKWCRFFLIDLCGTEEDLAGYDFLIGTGTHTHLPMLLYKKKIGVPVVSCMTPSSMLINSFDLLFVPLHDNAPDRNNIVNTIGPPSNLTDLGMHDPDRVLVLIGGIDQKSHVWHSDEIVERIEKLVNFEPSRQYSISSSPRTPKETAQKISSMSKNYDNVMFYDFKDTQPGWVEKEYNRSRYVWVTADSISMVYEAIGSGCRVGIIPVEWLKQNSKFTRSEKYLKDMGIVISIENYFSGNTGWKHEGEFNQAELCAEEIIRRLG